MQYRIIQPPSDGFSQFEELFIRDLFVAIYQMLPNPTAKFVLISYYECGYKEEEIATMLNVTQSRVSQILKKSKCTLRQLKKEGKL